jgi:hypothetical protein
MAYSPSIQAKLLNNNASKHLEALLFSIDQSLVSDLVDGNEFRPVMAGNGSQTAGQLMANPKDNGHENAAIPPR